MPDPCSLISIRYTCFVYLMKMITVLSRTQLIYSRKHKHTHIGINIFRINIYRARKNIFKHSEIDAVKNVEFIQNLFIQIKVYICAILLLLGFKC